MRKVARDPDTHGEFGAEVAKVVVLGIIDSPVTDVY